MEQRMIKCKIETVSQVTLKHATNKNMQIALCKCDKCLRAAFFHKTRQPRQWTLRTSHICNNIKENLRPLFFFQFYFSFAALFHLNGERFYAHSLFAQFSVTLDYKSQLLIFIMIHTFSSY